MTAPASAVASSAFSEISTNIAAIQATIAAIVGPAATTSGTTSASGSQFASELSSASGTSDAATDTTTRSGGITGNDVVSDAKSYLGVPYVWGGESRSGLDCSGLVQKTYHDLGISLPRTAAEQQSAGTPVASLADAQPGDLLLFGKPAYHVAIYLGNNQLIESPEPGKTVHITDVYQTPTSIRRIVPDAGTTTVAATTGGGLTASQLESAGLNPAVAAYASQFAAAESHYALPTGLLAAVAQQESGGNAKALSSAGAEGLMQLMPATASGLGVNPDDPSQAISAAAKILASSLHRYDGSIPLALAAYNAGPGAVAKYGGIPPYAQTENYVKDITAMMERGG
jgi:peptidoglycan DL-endopeptidase CwlO